MNKKLLRQSILQERGQMADKANRDEAITRVVLKSDLYQKSHTVFIYVSAALEVDTHLIIQNALQTGKIVAVPRCGENRSMTFHRITAEEDLAPGCFDILEPLSHCPQVVPNPGDLCIVPALAVDKDGNRLGFGGGYYDRFLQNQRFFTMALCYSLTDNLTPKKWDIPMDSVATPSGIVNFNRIS